MEKMRMESVSMAEQNISAIAAIFPNCITEAKGTNGSIKKAVNFNMLRQMLSPNIVEGSEAYEFTWVGKKASLAEANTPIRKTLRPCIEESAEWNSTENLYIEGDNLEVLKLLQESYLNKIKMIYIDPPYNTGNDFIYRDDFTVTAEEYSKESGQRDESGNRLFKNTDANGRFHSVWCSMIYPRLLLARNLLSEDGVIFISIDDNEIENMIKLGCEVFGEANHLGEIVVKSNPRGSMSTAEIAKLHEYLVIFSKNRVACKIIGHLLTEDMNSEYKLSDEYGSYRLLGLRMRGGFWRRSDRPKLYYPIYINPKTSMISLEKNDKFCEVALPIQPSTMEDGTWRWSKEKVMAESHLLLGKPVMRNGETCWDVYQKDYLNKSGGERRTKAKSIWDEAEINYQNGAAEIRNLFSKGGIFDYSKPVFLIKRVLEMLDLRADDIILDFFSGSATTAHAVMQLNAEDGGKRKFIMVQLPEETAETSEAYKAGYKNICEIGKERIRRAAKKIAAEHPDAAFDSGFRVFKLDESNMRDVYYAPKDYSQSLLQKLESNIKPDRTALDLLFGCLLEWALPLSLPYTQESIGTCTVHNYNSGDLIACFDDCIPEDVIRAIAQKQPLRAVFKDGSFKGAPEKINAGEIFKMLAPHTRVKVL